MHSKARLSSRGFTGQNRSPISIPSTFHHRRRHRPIGSQERVPRTGFRP